MLSKTQSSTRPSLRIMLVLLTGLILPWQLHATVRFWTGGGANNNWNNGANWSTGVAPVANDDLIFQGGASVDGTSLNNTNNYTAGTVFNSITITGTNYFLRGNQVMFTNSGVAISAQHVTGANYIEFPIQLGATTQTFECSATGAFLYFGSSLLPTINLNGQSLTFTPTGTIVVYDDITGTGNLTKNGAGRLALRAFLANSYVGTCSVNAGTLELNDSAGASVNMVTGNLNINNASIVEVGEGNQIADTANVTMNGAGQFNLLGGSSETISNLTIAGSSVASGAGTLHLNGDLRVTTTSTTPTISGNLHFVGGLHTITVPANTPIYDLDISASISDDGGGLLFTNVTPVGNFIRLLGSNTFTGPVIIQNVLVAVESPWSLGSTAAGTTVEGAGQLWMFAVGITNEALTLADGARWTAQNECAWSGAVALNGSTTIRHYPDGTKLDIIGAITGTGGFAKTDIGTVRLSGSAANTFSGATLVNEGVLELNKSSSWAIGAGSLTVGDGWGGDNVDIVRYVGTSTSELNTSVEITVKSSGWLQLNGHTDSVGTIIMDGGDIETGAGELQMYGDLSCVKTAATNDSANLFGRINLPAPRTFAVSDPLYVYANVVGAGGLTKSGSQFLFLTASNAYAGLTVVQAGYLQIQNAFGLGSSAAGTVVSNGASLVLNGSFGITNESLSLNGFGPSSYGALDSETSGTNYWVGPITLEATSDIAAYGAGTVLRIDGYISGPGGLTCQTANGGGSGLLYLDGGAANAYAGVTTVLGGTLLLNKTVFDGSIPGNLVIGNNVGADTVRSLRANQIVNSALVTINTGALLDLNNNLERVGSLDLMGGVVQSGSATLFLNGNSVTTRASSTQSTISGNLNLDGGLTIFNVANGAASPDLTISAVVLGGAGGILKTNSGNLQLTAANSYSGLTTINDGFILITDPAGLGTGAAGTVLNGGNLSVVGATVLSEPLTNNSTASILQASGASGWDTNVVLNAELEVQVLAAGTFDIAGPISGIGGLTKTVTGTLRYSGSSANTYSGQTTVSAGTLELNKAVGNGAVPGALVIGDGSGGVNADVVRLLASNQIGDGSDLTINASGLWDLGVFNDTIDALAGSGNITFGVNGYVTIGASNGSSAWNGVASGPGYAAGYTMRKTGSGTITFTGDNTYLAQTRVDGGTLIINGSQPQSPLVVASTGTAGGTGTVGDISCAGNLQPGTSPGLLTCSNVFFASTGDYYVDLTGTTPGVGYDQLNIRGTNNLGSSTLHLSTAFTSPVALSNYFVIMQNDGADATVGTFAGLAENATINQGGYTFRINYGNDVLLTVVDVPGASASTAVSAGNGDGVIAPNECNHLNIVVSNKTASAMTGVTASLASITPGVWVTQPYAPYPNLAANGKSTNQAAFQISTTTNFVCGSDVALELTVMTATHGSFVIPVTIPTGVPAAVPLRYDVSTTTNIPDVGTIESTNTVAGFVGPLKKVAVSLWLTHAFDGDLSLTLISPDGVAIDLSSGNGGGANFGSSCSPDGNRTTFDDAAATAITAGSPPYVGSYRPEASLAALAGGTANGQWRLRVTDANGGTLGTLRCWSVFLYGADCGMGSGQCELCPNVTLLSAFGASSSIANGYINPNGVPSVCGVAKVCPGTTSGGVLAEYLTFRNGPTDACITVTLENTNSALGMVAAAYAAGFNPNSADKCANYLADIGNIAGPAFGDNVRSFAFNASSNATFVIALAAGGSGPYRLTVSGGDCRPVLNVTALPGNKAKLDWSTAAGGYQLESTNNLFTGGAPIWWPVTNQPIVANGRFNVTNTAPASSVFYHLRKPMP